MDQLTPAQLLTVLNTAGLGLVAWRMLTVTEKKMDRLTEAINRMVRVDALALAHDMNRPREVRQKAEEVVREIDASNNRTS